MTILSLRTATLLLVVVIAGLLIYDGIRIARALALSEKTANDSSPYESSPADPAAFLLVVGDSTAVGTGASDNRESVAGRIGVNYPRVQVINEAVVGARVADLEEQLNTAPDRAYDALLIQIGATTYFASPL